MLARLVPSPAWAEVIRMRVREFYTFRANIPFSCIIFAVQLYVLREVWAAVYDGRAELHGVAAQTLLVYLSLGKLQQMLFSTGIAWNIQQRVLSGNVAINLLRPFGFLPQMIGMQIGEVVFALPLLVVFVPITALVGALNPPSPEGMLLYLVSLVLAFLVNMLIWMHIGLLAFWMLQVNGVRAMLSIAQGFLAGALVPLWLMPSGLRTVLEILPFQATVFLPASIYTGARHGTETLIPLGIQLIWIVILSLTVTLMWQRAQHKIVVQGG
jgi:ABC-2 type transport system permease protein